jgi:hypothetical protein
MKGFWNELRLIPAIVWPLALLISVGPSAYFLFFKPDSPKLSVAQLVFGIWVVLFFFAWVLVIGYIYSDARRRGMHYITWTLLAIFIPNFIGAVLYFVMREPQLVSCHKCGARARSNFVFCAQCGTELAPACPNCKRSVEPGWQLCAYCGTGLPEKTNDPTYQSS